MSSLRKKRRGLPQPGDIVMTTEAPLGEIAQLGSSRVALAQRLITLRGKNAILDNTFLKFLMQSAEVQNQLRARATGTTVLGIKQRELRKVVLTLPSLPEQRAIAHILGALDDKVELNRQMNETLESIARATFKSWFIRLRTSPRQRRRARYRITESDRRPVSRPPCRFGAGKDSQILGSCQHGRPCDNCWRQHAEYERACVLDRWKALLGNAQRFVTADCPCPP